MLDVSGSSTIRRTPPFWTCSIENIGLCFAFRALVLRTKAYSTQTGSYVLPRQFPTKTANAPLRAPQVATGDLLLKEGKSKITA